MTYLNRVCDYYFDPFFFPANPKFYHYLNIPLWISSLYHAMFNKHLYTQFDPLGLDHQQED